MHINPDLLSFMTARLSRSEFLFPDHPSGKAQTCLFFSVHLIKLVNFSGWETSQLLQQVVFRSPSRTWIFFVWWLEKLKKFSTDSLLGLANLNAVSVCHKVGKCFCRHPRRKKKKNGSLELQQSGQHGGKNKIGGGESPTDLIIIRPDFAFLLFRKCRLWAL